MLKFISRSKIVIAFLSLFNLNSFADTQSPKNPLAPSAVEKLTLTQAKNIAETCINHQLTSGGAPIAIAIFNDEARLLYFARMDGTSVGSAEAALQKGESAALYRYSTRETQAWIKSNPAVIAAKNISGIPGGVPLRSLQGAALGGVGVSGASADDDEKCALIGAASLKL